MDNENPFNLRDQGVFQKGYEISLAKILRNLTAPTLNEREPRMDDFWLVSNDAAGDLMICLGSKERCSVFYGERRSNGWWACDHNHEGDPIFAWDPGSVEKLIPARYMILHQDAIPIITEFWNTGQISDVTGWSPYEHDELDYPISSTRGHSERETKTTANSAAQTTASPSSGL